MTPIEGNSTALSVTDTVSLATHFAKSGFFADAHELSQAVVKIQAGIELGFGPVYAMTKIYIVKGRIMVSAEAMGAAIKRTGRYDYHVKALTDTECALEFTDNGKPVYTSKFNLADAQRAELVKLDSGWKKWPRAMLVSKALSQGARIVCPHVIAGVYVPADFAVETDEAGTPVGRVDIIEPPVTETPAPPAPPPPVLDMITTAQQQKIFAAAKQHGYNEEDVRRIIIFLCNTHHTSALTKVQAGKIIEAIEAETALDGSAPAPESEDQRRIAGLDEAQAGQHEKL